MRSLDSKTVLVTGATGFIGRHLVNRLRQIENIRLVLLSRKTCITPNPYEIWVCSSLNQLTPKIWQDNGIDQIDVVFHLGAFTPKSASEANEEEPIFRDNIYGTRTLLSSFPSFPERFIFASTLDVYSTQLGKAINENDRVYPAGLYGASKLFCEQLVRIHAGKHGFDSAILRYGHIFGPGEEAYEKLIPLLIHRLLKGEPPVLYGDGSALRDFLYVEDAVEATLRAAFSEKKNIGPVNIVRGQSVSVRDIAEELIKLIGFTGEIQYLRDRPVGDSLRFDNRRMKELLGEWKIISLAEGLQYEVDSFRRLCR
ncbi:MAG: NAD(P)-dependent oxidoreductase [Desulfosalsimonadaceae bacterium]